MAQKASVTCLDLILMTPKSPTFLQSKLFIAVLHTVTIELLSMCAKSLLSAQTPTGGTWSALGPRVPPLPALPSSSPSAHASLSAALWLS